MHDIANVALIIATIVATTAFRINKINTVRVELIGGVRGASSGTQGLRTELTARLDSIHRDMREFCAEQARHDVRITNLEQQHKN